jgi:ribosomal protein L6P/L9E
MKNIIKKQTNFSHDIKLFLSFNTFSIVGPLGNASFNTQSFFDAAYRVKTRKRFCCTFFRSFSKTIIGLTLGFTTRVVLLGVGFRIEAQDCNSIRLKIGFSKLSFFTLPQKVLFFITKKKTSLVLYSIDEQVLAETCRKLSNLKFPDAYRGKGIRYKHQVLLVKQVRKKK